MMLDETEARKPGFYWARVKHYQYYPYDVGWEPVCIGTDGSFLNMWDGPEGIEIERWEFGPAIPQYAPEEEKE